ncbi:uncharacterized protein LOC126686516 isoform X2 [Mercurialis annua]|uniref:uncharacterized protein LOC126686516 isoform X2 n=1 Tax=Mercurialis annua TaxID=3986 RepID=UPI00215FDE56|nr:uncharacterized protein LOC126686516 isoform X2 [Mercurialis annua]
MEATATGGGSGVVASSRGSSLPISSSRKEWRAISDHHSVRNGVDEEMERSNLGQSDERTIYEVQHRREPADVDFCSITVDGSLDNNILQQRIHAITRQREELQQMEIELKAQMIARSDIIEMQNSFDSRIKEHKDSAAKLQEQLHEREQAIHELERRMEEKGRELHAIKLDNEAAWAKEGLLREQNKELATYRERDHSEAERGQHMQQIHDLQEHIQEKERQILELQDQRRADQEAIFLKDEQLKVWIARVQEMDAMQSTTNHSLQVELRERTEQYNQLWLGCQRQLAEIERHHLHTIQQLHLELADARERNGSYPDESHISQASSKEASNYALNNGIELDVSGSGATSANNGALTIGNADNASNQTDHAAGVPIAPSSLLGMPSYLPPGQVTALHPYIMHQQGIPQSMPSHVPQSHFGHFHSLPAVSSHPQWHNQQAVSEGAQFSQTDHNHIRADAKYEYETVTGQGFHPDYLDVNMSNGTKPNSVISSSTGEAQALESMDRSYLVSSSPDQGLQQISSHFNDSLQLNSPEQNNQLQEQNLLKLDDKGLNGQVLTEEQASSASLSLSEASALSVNLSEATISNNAGKGLAEASVSTGQTNAVNAGKISETVLLDERSLLACIVRTIPAGGRIRINSTLPNRLGKMLAPLHWHDYKKKFGKLDDFVAGHPELFSIEGENIQLREGAQEMIAATAAVAKVAAAAAASSPYSSYMSSVAVTPMAQSHRLRKVPSIDSKHPNGVSFGAAGGISNVKILSKPKESPKMDELDFDRLNVTIAQSKGAIHRKSNSSITGKQQGRMTGASLTSGRS